MAKWFLRNKNFVNVFSLFQSYHLLEKWCGPSFEKNLNPFTQGCIEPSLVEIGPVVLEKIFKFLQCIFANSWLSPLWKRAGPFFWTNFSSYHPSVLCAKFGWNWFWRWGWKCEKFTTTMTTDNGQSSLDPLAQVS